MTTFEERLKEALSDSYNIERELGGGGMSRVFVAIDRSLGRKIVVKVLSPELIADVNRGRFQREIKVAAQLQHPHIVPLLSAGEHEDLVWYTMPFIAGESLRSAVEKNGPMSVPDVVRVLYHVGEALDYAHGEGVVHRDIKAANILRSGTYALVTDFGVAKALNASMPAAGVTQTGTAIGTPAYMAPEQLAGDPTADHRIDIYALGLLAYELLNGRSPFAATTPAKVLVAVLSEDPKPLVEVRPDVPRSLSALVMRCLSKEPDERPATARMLLDSLDAFSTASGEIRTFEHKIPHLEPTILTVVPPITGLMAVSPATQPLEVSPTTGPVAASATSGPIEVSPASGPVAVPPTTGPIAVPATPAEGLAISNTDEPFILRETYKSRRTLGRRSQQLIGGLALFIPVIAGAVFLSQRSTDNSSVDTPAPSAVPAVNSPAPGLPAPGAGDPQPGALPQNVAAAPQLDSQARADSLKKARAAAAKLAAAKKDSLLADSAKRVAAFKSDSSRRVQGTIRTRARAAASGLLANPGARKSFTQGATRKGGLLGSRTKGDLQTQIDALQPFLKGSGLTYEQFKDAVKAAGITLFDQFGRMMPDSLQRFVVVSR
ncbi:MAG: serine/threonine protein kinase [Gemmatimonadota bacterium]|nr:serine/threonine protein kinase [Gemmatimonadota bacterium]